MSSYQANVTWNRSPDEAFTDRKYSRAHVWRFDGGAEIPASSSPNNVRVPFSRVENVDPEEALVAAASSCHMLTFLAFAASEGYVIDSYEDSACAEVTKTDGKFAIRQIVLRPHIIIRDAPLPSARSIDSLHRLAHENCIVANSLATDISIQGTAVHAGT